MSREEALTNTFHLQYCYENYCVVIPDLFFVNASRPADCSEVHHEGHDPAATDRPALVLRHPHVRHHWSGVLQWEA